MSLPELSVTEQHIVSLAVAGCSPREIAVSTGMDKRTVDWHLARAARKLQGASALHRRVMEVIESTGDRRKTC